jgi:hypothetical protein
LGKKLLSGEGALTEEVMGPQVGALPRGAHRGPMIHTTPELRARLDPQEIDLDTRGIGLDAVMKTHELVQDYQAAVRGDPQLEPIVNDLEKRLQKVLDNAQTPDSAPDVPPTPVTSPHPEPPASRTPSAIEPERPTPHPKPAASRIPPSVEPVGSPILAEVQARARQQWRQDLLPHAGPNGGTIDRIVVEDVEFTKVTVSWSERELRIGYLRIEKLAGPQGAGMAVHDALEEAAVQVARQVKARAVRVYVRLVFDPGLLGKLQARQYQSYEWKLGEKSREEVQAKRIPIEDTQ